MGLREPSPGRLGEEPSSTGPTPLADREPEGPVEGRRPRAKLRITMHNGVGFLKVPYLSVPGRWQYYSIRFLPAKIVLLLALKAAFEEDSQEPSPSRGWRALPRVAALIGKQTDWEPGIPAVRSTMSAIEKQVREVADAVRAISPDPDFPQMIIERARKLGARLALDFDIEDLGDPAKN